MLGSLSYVITAQTEPLKKELSEAQKSMKGADTQMKRSGNAIVGESKKMGTGASQNVGALTSNLGTISPAAGQAVGGMQSMGVAARALNMALGPIGIAIGAIGLAIKALTSYFTGSIEGQLRWANIMAYIGGVTDTVKDAMIDLGKVIADTFQFDKEEKNVRNLGDVMKEHLMMRFQGVVQWFTAGWEVISKGAMGVAYAVMGIFDKEKREQAKEYFKDAAKGFLDFQEGIAATFLGIDNINDRLAKMAGAADDRAQKALALQKRANALQMDEFDNSVKIAKINAEYAAARLIANDDTNKTAQEQMAAITKAQDLLNEKYAIEEKMAIEKLAIQRETMALGHDETSDKAELAKLEVELINLGAKRDSDAKALLRRKTTIHNQVKAEGETEAKIIEENSKAKQAAIDAELESRANILEQIRHAGLTEVERLQETLDKKLAMYDWSEQERLLITQEYQDKITDIEIAAEEEQKKIQENKIARISEFSSALASIAEQQNLINQAYAEGLDTEQMEETLDAMIEKMQEVTNLSHLMNQSFLDLGMAVMNAGITASNGMREFGEALKEVVRSNIAALIAEGVAGAVSRALTSVPFPFNLAVAATAGGLAAAVFNSAIPKFATGGEVPGGYPNDTYPAFLTSGEKILPPKALPDFEGNIMSHITQGISQLSSIVPIPSVNETQVNVMPQAAMVMPSQGGRSGGQLTARVSKGDLLFILREAMAEQDRNF